MSVLPSNAASMIGPGYVQTMARYNAWQNQWMYLAADGLTPDERAADRGAFFGGIQATLSHLMWGDTIWIARFDGGESVASPGATGDTATAYEWPTMKENRPRLDARIAAWAWSTDAASFEGDLTWYSGVLKREMRKPRALCVMQLFNHQTHHRGQVHAMLTACGVKTVDTDLPFMPDEVPEWH